MIQIVSHIFMTLSAWLFVIGVMWAYVDSKIRTRRRKTELKQLVSILTAPTRSTIAENIRSGDHIIFRERRKYIFRRVLQIYLETVTVKLIFDGHPPKEMYRTTPIRISET